MNPQEPNRGLRRPCEGRTGRLVPYEGLIDTDGFNLDGNPLKVVNFVIFSSGEEWQVAVNFWYRSDDLVGDSIAMVLDIMEEDSK